MATPLPSPFPASTDDGREIFAPAAARDRCSAPGLLVIGATAALELVQPLESIESGRLGG